MEQKIAIEEHQLQTWMCGRSNEFVIDSLSAVDRVIIILGKMNKGVFGLLK
jgi:hypothetical protein